MKVISLDNQEIRLPEKKDWYSDEFVTLFKSWKNYDFESLYNRLEKYSNYKGITIGVIGYPGRCITIALIKIAGEYHRIHIENVICNHCNKQSGVSGTPGVWELYYGCNNTSQAMKRSMALPVKSCIHCGKPLKHRHTIWFENE
ncbi:hypothetical protein [Zooshikella sp. RANM57]|uniref:hypothetical protein n=1 Tax=Zooshikella sp. RANM57 TaxID=3425863 RepID=UPI003D6DF82B